MIHSKQLTREDSLPKELADTIFRELEGFDQVCYFRWDLHTDTQSPIWASYANPFVAPPAHDVFDFLYNAGAIYSKDFFLFDDFWHHIHTSSECPANGRERKELELRVLSADKTQYLWAAVNILTCFTEGVPVTVFMSIRNINTQKEQQLEILLDAEVDKLTGFLNKPATERHIQEYLRLLPPEQSAPIFFILDADGFKTINDTFGHLFGDAVLADMALVIEKYFRTGDILGRIGGDEFIILAKEMPNSIELISHKCQELVNALQRTYEGCDQSIPFSVSIGVARYDEQCQTFKKLFSHADLALYNAKSKGKNTFTIYKEGLVNAQVPMRTEIDSVYSAEFQQRAFKDNMIEFIFRLLYETKNSDATISLSLGLLGKQFNMDRLAIDFYNQRTNSYSNAFEWLGPKGMSRNNSKHPDIAKKDLENINRMIISRYQVSGFGSLAICEDTRTLNEAAHGTFTALHCHSFAHCKIIRGTEEVGCVGFETAEVPHHYTEDELNNLSIFAGLLGSILLSRENDTVLAHKNKRLMDIIDHMQELICVIDKDTHELLFFNQALRQALPETASAEACYYRFHKLSEPCSGCPVMRLSANGAEYIESILNSWGCPTLARAFNIEWSPERKAALIIVEPF